MNTYYRALNSENNIPNPRCPCQETPFAAIRKIKEPQLVSVVSAKLTRRALVLFPAHVSWYPPADLAVDAETASCNRASFEIVNIPSYSM